ncbi:MAG TPA: hypothetical protein VII49_06555 [Rhizomicrobium sp.]
MKGRFAGLLALSALISLLRADLLLAGTARIATVCQLSQHGASFDGQYVRVKATYLTDLHHFSLLKDPACPRDSIDEDEGQTPEANPGLKRFDEAVLSAQMTSSSGFEVEVSGKFLWQRNWQPPLLLSRVMKAGPRGVLIVDKVWDFKRSDGDKMKN